jgi:hypothetical protein
LAALITSAVEEALMIEAIVICLLGIVIGYGVWAQWKMNRDQNKINDIVFETVTKHDEIIKKHSAALQKDATTKETDSKSKNLPA